MARLLADSVRGPRRPGESLTPLFLVAAGAPVAGDDFPLGSAGLVSCGPERPDYTRV